MEQINTVVLVSIIIPVFNLEKYIGRCIESCLNQTVNNYEVIVVNDGSTDKSAEIIAGFANKDKRVRLINGSNSGAAAARKKGVQEAKGLWITFVDGDDYIDSTLVESLLEYAKKGADTSICYIALDKKADTIELKSELPLYVDKISVTKYLLSRRISFSLCAKLFRRDLFDSIDMRCDLKIGEDAYWTTQLLLHSVPNISIIKKTLYHYVERIDSTLHRPSRDAVYSRLFFIDIIKSLLERELKQNFSEITDEFNNFCCDEYYGFLLMNGKWHDISIEAKPVFKRYIKNKGKQRASLQNFIVMSYLYLPFVGDMLIQAIGLTKKIIYKLKYH